MLVGVHQYTVQKIDWLTNGLHSKVIFGFGLWIALQNIGVLKYPGCGLVIEVGMVQGILI